MGTVEGSGSWDTLAKCLHSHFPPAVPETLPSCPGLSHRAQSGPGRVPCLRPIAETHQPQEVQECKGSRTPLSTKALAD